MRSGVIASDLADFLEAGDRTGAIELLRSFLADIPYDIHIKAERYYQTIFYTFFQLVGIFVEAEGKDITLVGASFGAAERNLVEWKTARPPEAGEVGEELDGTDKPLRR